MTHLPISATSDTLTLADELRAGDLVVLEDDVLATVTDASAMRTPSGRTGVLVGLRSDGVDRQLLFDTDTLICRVAA